MYRDLEEERVIDAEYALAEEQADDEAELEAIREYFSEQNEMISEETAHMGDWERMRYLEKHYGR